MRSRPKPRGVLARLLHDLRREARGERIAVRDALAAGGGGAGALRLMALAALVLVTPLSGIPLMATLCGIVIALSAAQALMGARRVWVPAWMARLSVPTARMEAAFARIAPLADWLDAHVRRRWRPMRAGPVRAVLLAMCFLAGALMPVLEFVPFSSSVAGAFVLLTALGLLARDGLVNALAMLPLGGAVGAAVLIAG